MSYFTFDWIFLNNFIFEGSPYFHSSCGNRGGVKQGGVFDVEEQFARLIRLGDQFEAFSRIVDFEEFRPDLGNAMAYADGSQDGRPPFDPVMMLNILVIQTLNNLYDERTEYFDQRPFVLHAFSWPWAIGPQPDTKTSGCF